MFLATTEAVVKSPQSTTNPPQLHHTKNERFPPPLKNARKNTKKAPATAGDFFLANSKS
jgi:hypothetical protein